MREVIGLDREIRHLAREVEGKHGVEMLKAAAKHRWLAALARNLATVSTDLVHPRQRTMGKGRAHRLPTPTRRTTGDKA